MHGSRSIFSGQSSRTTFQIMSDLHLEVGQQYSTFNIDTFADYLILAGDVGRLVDYESLLGFLKTQTDQFKRVFYVLGNHEFYGGTYDAGLQTAARLEKEPSLNGRLVLLHRTRHEVPESNISILGCTLWSSIHSSAAEIVRSKVKDHRNIQNWTIEQHNANFAFDEEWLRNEVEAIRNENSEMDDPKTTRAILVITHHAPSVEGTSSPRHSNNPWTCAFASDVISKGEWPGVKSWVFGHTHYTTEFEKDGINVVSNQRGYVIRESGGDYVGIEKNQVHSFDPKKVLVMP
ncbi:ser/Thr protein phosphatase-like protein superfamily [Corynespora cassiicola Philippines]|uniref:Ser/Thr protein phosphatase-like protein superfamily n=1 Tax=Corynespora cassiicola Philippines TaxID=1448308 RepID=A0A2T2N3P3_CORCC|nr:ser/Thr protein phosphatase-like protein superfamily [Corynespora cassiicola Philippines]